MNALVAAPLVEVLSDLVIQLGHVRDAIASSSPPAGPIGGAAAVVERLLTIRAGYVGVEQPDADAASIAEAKVEVLDMVISMLGGKVPKERRRREPAIQPPAPVKKVDGALVVAPLPKMERKLLAVLAGRRLKPTSQEQLAVLAGYSVSGSFTAALGALRAEGYVVGSGEDIRITHHGLVMVPVPSTLAPADVRAQWLGKLEKMERLMLQTLLEAYPHELSDDELADRTGYSISGSFTAALGRLRRLELVERLRPGVNRASEELAG